MRAETWREYHDHLDEALRADLGKLIISDSTGVRGVYPLEPPREKWEFGGRTRDGLSYRWRRVDTPHIVHMCPVHEFWPAPKPEAAIRPNSILDWIARRFFERPQPGTKADYTLAKGDHHA